MKLYILKDRLRKTWKEYKLCPGDKGKALKKQFA